MRSINNRPLDEYQLIDIKSKDTEHQNYVRERMWRNKEVEDQTSDLFHGLKREFDWTKNPNKGFKRFIESVKDTEDFKNLQARCKGNDIVSWASAKKMEEKVLDFKDEGNLPDENDPEALKNFMKSRDAQDIIRAFMRQAVEEADAEAKEVEEILKAAGYSPDGKGDNKNLKIEDIMSLVQYFKKMKDYHKILDGIGRAKQSAITAIQTRTIFSEDEIVGVELGNDIERLCMEEVALPQIIFNLKFIEGELQQYTFCGRDPFAFGPIILIIDESGSMEGENIYMAKTFMFGMWQIAKKQKRPMFVIRFDEDIVEHEIKEEMDMIHILHQMLGGGTNFEKPLTRAMDIIDSMPKYKKADILFITDGRAHVSQELINRISTKKKKMDFKIVSLVLGWNTDAVKEFSDVAYDKRQLQEFTQRGFSV